MTTGNPFVFPDPLSEFERTVSTLARSEFYDGCLARATQDELPWTALKRLARHGLLKLGAGAEVGGDEADPVSLGIAIEQVAYADFNLAYLELSSTFANAVVTK